MDVQQLRSFRSVVATGSVRAAADTLGYSPSAVSQQLAQLQQRIGVTLLAKSGRGVEPTAAGHALAERIDVLLTELGDLDVFVRHLRDGHTTAATLLYFSSLGPTWLPDIVGTFIRQHPDVPLELATADAFDPARRPRPDVQLVTTRDAPPTLAGYRALTLTQDPFVVVLPPGHALGEHPAISLKDLEGETWIDNDSTEGSCRKIVMDACAALGFQPTFRLRTPDYPTALALATRGAGITVLPALAAASSPDGACLRPFNHPAPSRTITALVATATQNNPPVDTLVSAIVTAAAHTP